MKPFLQQPHIRAIPLTQGKFAIVDAEDYDWLSQYKWCVQKAGDCLYAVRSKKRATIKMHREIIGAPKRLMCDHIDHNGLNNCKSNLRLCTNAQNSYNRQARINCTSKYKGVSWKKADRKWQVLIGFEGKRICLGLFDNEMEAAMAYDDKAIELFGEFACVNLPERIELKYWIKKLVWAA
jgi:hypothetical protein